MGVVATAAIKINADIRDLKKGLSESEKMVQQFGGMVKRAAGLIGGAWLGREFIRNSIEAQAAVAQLNAVVKSTGGVAGFATPQLTAMAGELQKVSTFSDEAIMGAQGLLLTFTKIRGDVLPAATKAVMDMATALGTDLKSASIQVGKALNDPKLGLTALTRSGVSFSEAQKTVIKNLVDTGRVVEAQKLILAELEVQFGGSAAAARNTLGGALKALSNAFGDTLEVSGEATSGIVQGINSITEAMPGARDKVNSFFTNFQLGAIEAAAWVTRLNDKLALLQLRFASGLAKIGLRSWAQKEAGAAMRALEDSMTGGADAVEKWRQAQIAAVLGLGGKLNERGGGVSSLTDKLKEATAAAKELAATLKGIGSLDIMGSYARERAARIERGRAIAGPVAAGAQKTLGDAARAQGYGTANSPLLATLNAQVRAQTGLVASAETLGSKLKEGLASVSFDLIRGLAGVAASLLIGGGGRGSQIGGGLGSTIGGGIGSIVGIGGGPIGSVIGGAVGSVVGGLAGSLFGGLFDKKKKVASGLDMMATQLDRVNASLRNVPSGYKIARIQHDSTFTGMDPDSGRPPGPGAGPGLAGPGSPKSVNFYGDITVVSNDPDDKLRKIERKIGKAATRGGTSRLKLATA